ncbi:hypothetical protein P154DRAFT_204119 [Amniculicola lignicola CBS 123094]|uniref:Uncharacterized protein n=1 Tax=Amniculicola lignicola CBS 123094 TaxID=1392246 RepID=A0A6A5WHC1_9PLEO|nr:hypothetical protein P154DRAFT_204119 [Amniculicola lignicola CBS 123094]
MIRSNYPLPIVSSVALTLRRRRPAKELCSAGFIRLRNSYALVSLAHKVSETAPSKQSSITTVLFSSTNPTCNKNDQFVSKASKIVRSLGWLGAYPHQHHFSRTANLHQFKEMSQRNQKYFSMQFSRHMKICPVKKCMEFKRLKSTYCCYMLR